MASCFPTPVCHGMATHAGRFQSPAFLLPHVSTGGLSPSSFLSRKRRVSTVKVRPWATPSSASRMRRRRLGLRCELTRLSGNAAHRVLPALATRDQWAHFWGTTEVQRMGKLVEVVSIVLVGLWACFFTSFFLGVGTTSILGAGGLFYWLLAPNLSAYNRNRALRGRIAPYPGGDGNSVAIFSARVATATEEYHPVTGRPVFLRMVIEDEEGRALKFRTRTSAEYARIRAGMVAEAVLVSPDSTFEEIVGVSDTFIPAIDSWVGEYPYVDKVVFRRLLDSREAKRRARRPGHDQKELDITTFEEFWTNAKSSQIGRISPSYFPEEQEEQEEEDREGGYEDDPEEYEYEGWGAAGFSSRSETGGPSNAVDESTRRSRQWERVSGQARPRRVAPDSGRRGTTGGSNLRQAGNGGYDSGWDTGVAVRVHGTARDSPRNGL